MLYKSDDDIIKELKTDNLALQKKIAMSVLCLKYLVEGIQIWIEIAEPWWEGEKEFQKWRKGEIKKPDWDKVKELLEELNQ